MASYKILKIKDLAGKIFNFQVLQVQSTVSDKFGERRRAIEKAMKQRLIHQPNAVSDHYSFPGHSTIDIELIPLELYS